jgi:SSS family solute:Na+ symporter
MLTYLLIIGAVYIGILMFFSWTTKKQIKTSSDFMLGGTKIGVAIGLMTFAATLFSTFTLLGMPDFSRTNGVGAWIFLTFSDAIMVFLILWFGFYLRKKVGQLPYQGMSALLQKCYQNRMAGYIYFVAVFIFLIPYIAIQIRGVAIFLVSAFPDFIPVWGWSIGIVLIMLVYSELGGLKAIIYADSLQGTLLLIVVWIVAINCLVEVGGWNALFEQVAAVNKDLLSTPGPKGLLSPQFLIASALAILMIPVTQPQLSTRLVIMKSYGALKRMATAVGFFAMLVIFPTIIIGIYGAIHYADATTGAFLGGVLLEEQHELIAAFIIIGLFAAAMSTSDSQLFAMGNEIKGLLGLKEEDNLKPIRIVILLFAVSALVFSLVSSDELVLLARLSFSGTALMGPMILLGVFSNRPQGVAMIILSMVALLLFILSNLGWFPKQILSFRTDLFLMMVLGAAALINYLYLRKK